LVLNVLISRNIGIVETRGYPQTLYRKTRFLSIRNIMHRNAFGVSFRDICASKGVFHG